MNTAGGFPVLVPGNDVIADGGGIGAIVQRGAIVSLERGVGVKRQVGFVDNQITRHIGNEVVRRIKGSARGRAGQ